MSIFLERFILVILAASVLGIILLNPFKLDLVQRSTLLVAVVALAFFIGHTLEKAKSREGPTSASMNTPTSGVAARPEDSATPAKPPSSKQKNSKISHRKEAFFGRSKNGTSLAPRQSTSGANSPNIAGNGNTVIYNDKSELPNLDDAKLTNIGTALAGSHFKVVTVFNVSDGEANNFSAEIRTACEGNGWTVDFGGWMGIPPIQSPVPLSILTSQVAAPEVLLFKKALDRAFNASVPVSADPNMAAGELHLIVVSRTSPSSR